MKAFKNICVLTLLIFILSACQTISNNNPSRKISDNRYEAGNLDILVDLKIVTDEELTKGTHITTRETLQVIRRIAGYDNIYVAEEWELSEWYRGDTYASLDYLNDADKTLLLKLSWYGSGNSILRTADILNISLDDNITNYEALIYITRMIGNTYSCTDYPEELDFTEKSQTYNTAFEKGVIDSAGIENADLPILRKDFFDIVHKAIFIERDIGGYAPITGKYIDSIIAKNERDTKDKEVTVNTQKISVEAIIHDDMSISWTLPQEWSHLNGGDMSMEIQLVREDGTVQGYMMGGVWDSIDASEIIECVADVYPNKLAYIRCTYYQYDDDYQAKEEWYFDIDVSNIEMVIEGEPVKPDTYTRFQKQWVPESISLADGELFKEEAYYLLTSYEHTYRKSEYNSIGRAIFTVDEACNTYQNTHDYGGAVFINGVGGVFLEEIHIQEITIQGDAKSGFVIQTTPESEEVFEVREGSEPS